MSMTIELKGEATLVVDDSAVDSTHVDTRTAAQLVGCNQEVFRRWLRDGKIPFTQRGRRKYVTLNTVRSVRTWFTPTAATPKAGKKKEVSV